ncbi:hypothetical protein OW763_05215 [Clostridium aestuarii]|uniref:Zinc ribbon domain-containing protein n=1 Tax=Clostridium aestuarii TaxID=338193 RepID=A0ABT4CXL8_9CLOT|nr:CD1247 N-terminal domain-containing protein [Clostridium aestuarii]MCY6483748.1 hypothetical protein [Clostridium aestuarii]
MNSLMSKVSSLNEALEELKVKENTKEAEVLCKMNDVLSEIVCKINEIQKEQLEFNEYVTILDENLCNLEEELYGIEEDEEEFNTFDYADIECEKCNEVLAIEKSLLNSDNKIMCPNCGNKIVLKDIKKN